ncbi:MAG: DUF1223 domain-containing protein [Chryseolinea sp.]
MKTPLLFCLTMFAFLNGNAQSNAVIIELFTSQGCSSCPAADKNLSEILKRFAKENKPVYGLSFHVDYWNNIGWKDPYSSKEFTNRQHRYAQQMNLSSIYTPQMIVNGKDEFVGSNMNQADVSIKEALKTTPAYQITINSVSITNQMITINYAINKESNGEILNVALVEKNAENYVSRGENEGKKLHHDNVVRSFTTVQLQQGGEIHIPIGSINAQNSSVILYIQNKDWRILGAVAKSLEGLL